MASGVKVHDDVMQEFQKMKLRKSPKKAICFTFSEDGKFIIVDKEKEILTTDCNGDFFQRLKNLFPAENCLYSLADIHYTTGESKKQELLLILWAPDCAKIKEKMLFASSKRCLTESLCVRQRWDVHDWADLTINQMAQKLSGKVKSLEGCDL